VISSFCFPFLTSLVGRTKAVTNLLNSFTQQISTICDSRNLFHRLQLDNFHIAITACLIYILHQNELEVLHLLSAGMERPSVRAIGECDMCNRYLCLIHMSPSFHKCSKISGIAFCVTSLPRAQRGRSQAASS
jgi:hypothetical protein